MIQILSKKDLSLIQDIDVVKCMEKQFARLEGFVDYPTEAYFIYLESIDELQQPIVIKRNGVDVIYPPLQRYVEMVETHHGIYEIVLILHNDFGISLFINSKNLTPRLLNHLLASTPTT